MTIQQHLSNRFSLSESAVKEAFNEYYNEDLDRILLQISLYFDVSIDDIKGKSRYKPFPLCRQLFFYFAKKKTGRQLEKLAQKVGQKHSNASISIKTIEGYLENDREIQYIAKELEEMV